MARRLAPPPKSLQRARQRGGDDMVPLSVAFVMPGIGVLRRGAEAFVSELAGDLASRPGTSVSVFCRGAAIADLPPEVKTERVRALPRDHPLINRLYRLNRLSRKILDTLFLDPLSVEWYTAALSAFPRLWRQRYDVVVMEGGLVGSWLCRLLRRVKKVPFIDIAHGLDMRWEGAFARARPDRVVTFTGVASRQIARRAPKAKIAVIPHGVDLDLFHPEAAPVPLDLPRPVIMTCGAVDDHKRMELAVAAVARLGVGSLLVLGEGPAEDELDRFATLTLGADRYLRTVAPRFALPGYYTAADCFTLPSRSESFGLTYLEAMACGLAAVAPDDDVRREVIGNAGQLCRVEHASDYARALREVLGRRWEDIPRRRAEGFPFQRTADAYARLIEDVALEGGG